MELTPQLLTDEIDFRIAVRGYDRNEVDDFLERVAVAVGQLQSQLAKAVARAKTAEKRLAEVADGGSALPVRETEPKAKAEPEAKPEPKAKPEPEVAPPPAAPAVISSDEDLNEELRRTLVLAQRTADSAIREAKLEAEGIIEASCADAELQRDEARRRLVDEIAELEAVRESMRSDTVVLERYLGDERARVRETIQVLRRLVDDPQSLQASPVPALSAAATPELSPAPAPAPDPEPEAAPEPEAESEDLGRLFETAEPDPAPGPEQAGRDWRSGDTERGDQGPHTQPVAAARFEEETDDAFLAELRRAMADNEPLGPDGK